MEIEKQMMLRMNKRVMIFTYQYLGETLIFFSCVYINLLKKTQCKQCDLQRFQLPSLLIENADINKINFKIPHCRSNST